MIFINSTCKWICGSVFALALASCQTEVDLRTDQAEEAFNPSKVLALSAPEEVISDYGKIERFFQKEFAQVMSPDVREIIVISSQGDCMNCNASYSRFVERFIDDPSVFFLVCTPGNHFDVSLYLEKESNENVFLDFADDFAALNLLERSGAIFIKEGAVENIMPISASTMTADFEIIANRISSRHNMAAI